METLIEVSPFYQNILNFYQNILKGQKEYFIWWGLATKNIYL